FAGLSKCTGNQCQDRRQADERCGEIPCNPPRGVKHRSFLPDDKALFTNPMPIQCIHASGDLAQSAAYATESKTHHLVVSPPSTIRVSTSPARLRRKEAASLYSDDVKHATPCSKVGNSITTKR